MDNLENYLSREDLELIKDAKIKAQIAHINAEKAALEFKLAEAEFKNVVSGIYLKNSLTMTDVIDETTGRITKNK